MTGRREQSGRTQVNGDACDSYDVNDHMSHGFIAGASFTSRESPRANANPNVSR